MMLWDSRTLTLIKTQVTECPVNAVTMSPLLDHVVIGGGQDASSVTTTDHRAGKFEAKFFDKGVPEQKLQGHLGSCGVTGNLALQPMYTLSGWWTFLPSFEEATENIPRPDDNITRTLHLFNLRGFNTRETASLLGNPFTSSRGLLFADQQLMAEEEGSICILCCTNWYSNFVLSM